MTRGLMKTASSIAVAAAAGLFATSAMAADLGGNCCADLEERVAELEATTARKGNRKVSLTVYGRVNKAILWHDSDEADAYRSDKLTIRDNSAASSLFGFRGEAQIRPDLTAGYNMEIQVYEDAGVDSGKNSLTIRHNYVYLDSATFGRISLGQTSQVTDGLYEINLANVTKVPGVVNEESGFLGKAFATTFADNIDGGRKQGVYYRTPTLAGFVLSAGYSHDTPGDGAWPLLDGKKDANDYWEVALRYAGEFNGVRLAAGIGYRKTEDNTSALPPFPPETSPVFWDSEAILGSASIMHVPTGLFLSGGYADIDSDDKVVDKRAFWLMAGIERNFFGIGNTTIFGEYGQVDWKDNAWSSLWYSGGATDPEEWEPGDPWSTVPALDGKFWGFGITQAIDSAATDLYINFRRYELDSASIPDTFPYVFMDDTKFGSRDASVVNAGMIIRF